MLVPCVVQLITFFFQGIFRNFGDVFLEKFKPGLERLVTDRSHEKHESSQRCAMEVLAGIIRGSKHWPYEKVSSLVSPSLLHYLPVTPPCGEVFTVFTCAQSIM